MKPHLISRPQTVGLIVGLNSLVVSTVAVAFPALLPNSHANVLPVIVALTILFGLLGALLFFGLALAPGRDYRHEPELRLFFCLALLMAASLHLILLTEHAEESSLLGLGFVFSGLAQAALASAVFVRPQRLAYYGSIGLNVALLFLYVVHVAVGLPLIATPLGVAFGRPDDVDLAGLMTKAAELLAIVLAIVLLDHPPASPRTSTVRQQANASGAA
ncbi:MAG: hypothetical protein M3077_03885 [Candidatus Dormibacteraeota bacterium]|nr:hypothetical protein [Candidatus Dormibacteraeota bacterium]